MAAPRKKIIAQGYSGRFVGTYVEDVRLMVEASFITGLHSIAIGAPGHGKTEIVEDVMRTILDSERNGRYIFQRFDPSTPPSAVKPKRKLVIDSNGKEALIDDPTGTVYQPGIRGAITDELGRANSAVFDAALDLFDRKDLPQGQQVIVATANFMPTSERQAALIDRIAFWQWVTPGKVDVKKIGTAQLLHLGNQSFVECKIDLKTIDRLHGLTPNEETAEAISEYVGMVSVEAKKAGFEVNPRRIYQWSIALYRYGAYVIGQEQFSGVPPKAAYILRWMMPTVTQSDYDKWQDVAKAFGDVVGSAITEALEALEKKARVISGEKAADGGARIAIEIEACCTMLKERFPKDDRVKDAIKSANAVFTKFSNGEYK